MKCEGSKILPCWQANKLSCHCFIDDGRRHLDSCVRNKGYHYFQSSEQHTLCVHAGFSCFTSPMRVMQSNPGGSLVCSMFVPQVRSTKFMEITCFIFGYRLTCLVIALEETLCWNLYWTINGLAICSRKQHNIYLPSLFLYELP